MPCFMPGRSITSKHAGAIRKCTSDGLSGRNAHLLCAVKNESSFRTQNVSVVCPRYTWIHKLNTHCDGFVASRLPATYPIIWAYPTKGSLQMNKYLICAVALCMLAGASISVERSEAQTEK